MAMAEMRRKFDQDFREGAVRLARETATPIAQVPRDLGINEDALGNWVNADKRRRREGNGAERCHGAATTREWFRVSPQRGDARRGHGPDDGRVHTVLSVAAGPWERG